MPGRRRRADDQLLADGLVAAALGDQGDDLKFPRGQPAGGRYLHRGPGRGGAKAAGGRLRDESPRASSTAELASRPDACAQPADGVLAEAPGRSEVTFCPPAGPRWQVGRLAERGRGGGQLNRPFRPPLRRRERREGLEPSDRADTAADGPAQLDALREVLPGDGDLALVHRNPAEASKAPRYLRPGVDLAQDGQSLLVSPARAVGVAGQPGQVGEAKERPGDPPLLIDIAHDRERGLGEPLCRSQIAALPGRGSHGSEGVPLVPPVAGSPRDGERLVRAVRCLAGPPGVQRDLGEQVERGRRPEILASRAAEFKPLGGVRLRSRRVTGQGELRAADECRAAYRRADRRIAEPEEGVEPLRPLGEGAPHDPDRRHGRAQPQPRLGLPARQVAAEHLPQVAEVGVEPAEGAHGHRPRGVGSAPSPPASGARSPAGSSRAAAAAASPLLRIRQAVMPRTRGWCPASGTWSGRGYRCRPPRATCRQARQAGR